MNAGITMKVAVYGFILFIRMGNMNALLSERRSTEVKFSSSLFLRMHGLPLNHLLDLRLFWQVAQFLPGLILWISKWPGKLNW